MIKFKNYVQNVSINIFFLGCELDCTSKEFSFCASYIAIDWDQTALHLRYLSNQEKAFVEDPSVEASLKVRN